jgi:alkanesulfonate monooxygenase SsuD/methylene tetrahydromethanopterin reductase-like flavin-dependent oxidoreductase (luciferase family)
MSAIAARTSRIKIGSLVTNVNLRNPALLAKMASSLDNISGGRLIVGLGVGDRLSQNELRTYGYRFPPTKERIDRLRETISILKLLWTKDEATFEGKHFQISQARNYPKPKQSPHPLIWIGGKHHELLDLAVEMANGWNCWGLSQMELAERESYLLSKCVEFDRRPESLVRSWAGTVRIGRKGEAYSRVVEEIKTELLRKTNGRTDYFIGSFDAETVPENYGAFAEAVKSIV